MAQRLNMAADNFILRKKMRVVGKLGFRPDEMAVRERSPKASTKGLWENVVTFSVTLRQQPEIAAARQEPGKNTSSEEQSQPPPLCGRGHFCELRTTLPERYRGQDMFQNESARYSCEKCGEDDPQPEEPFYHCAECARQYFDYYSFDLCEGCSRGYEPWAEDATVFWCPGEGVLEQNTCIWTSGGPVFLFADGMSSLVAVSPGPLPLMALVEAVEQWGEFMMGGQAFGERKWDRDENDNENITFTVEAVTAGNHTHRVQRMPVAVARYDSTGDGRNDCADVDTIGDGKADIRLDIGGIGRGGLAQYKGLAAVWSTEARAVRLQAGEPVALECRTVLFTGLSTSCCAVL